MKHGWKRIFRWFRISNQIFHSIYRSRVIRRSLDPVIAVFTRNDFMDEDLEKGASFWLAFLLVILLVTCDGPGKLEGQEPHSWKWVRYWCTNCSDFIARFLSFYFILLFRLYIHFVFVPVFQSIFHPRIFHKFLFHSAYLITQVS